MDRATISNSPSSESDASTNWSPARNRMPSKAGATSARNASASASSWLSISLIRSRLSSISAASSSLRSSLVRIEVFFRSRFAISFSVSCRSLIRSWASSLLRWIHQRVDVSPSTPYWCRGRRTRFSISTPALFSRSTTSSSDFSSWKVADTLKPACGKNQIDQSISHTPMKRATALRKAVLKIPIPAIADPRRFRATYSYRSG